MKNQNQKKCPCCDKDFRTRRQNQVYCKYSCKIKFNNEKARLRRLELLEIEKKYYALLEKMSQNKTEKTPTVTQNQSKPEPETKETTPIHWKSKLLKGTGIFMVIAIGCYYLYRFLFQESEEFFYPDLVAGSLLKPTFAKDGESEQSDQIAPIPTEIFPKKVINHPTDENRKVEKLTPSNFFPDTHPDVVALNKILKKNKVI